MSLREDVEWFAHRDSGLGEHHLGPHRVKEDELHPPRKDLERLSKERVRYKAKAVVEAFHAKASGRLMRSLDQEPSDITYLSTTSVDLDVPTLLESRGVEIKKCAFDFRGIVEVHCVAKDFVYDNPVYLVNPPMLVEDKDGDVEGVDEDAESGDPIILRYKEDPTQAMFDILVELKDEGGA